MLKRLPQDNLEDESIHALAGFFNASGWEFNIQSKDKSGIDAEIEIVHGVERTGRFLKGQVKAGLSYVSSENEDDIRIRIERKYLEHWAKMSVPVLVFFYHPTTRVIYWKAIKEYLALHGSILTRPAATCVIVFDKDQDCLDQESLVALEAVEAKRFRYDNILVERSHFELGWSNWFPVKTFPTLWEADTDAPSRSAVIPQLDHDYAFTIQGQQLFTFSDIHDETCELRRFVRVDSIGPTVLNNMLAPLIVELLNQALGIFAKTKNLVYRGEKLVFSESLLKSPEANKFSYPSLKRREIESRTKIYIQRIGNRIEYKHHAVRLSFVQHTQKWFLQIDPDWAFTYPYGQRRTRMEVGARVTSEKANTHNKDYLYLLHFWRKFLSDNQEIIAIPCSSLGQTDTVDILPLPLEFEFQFRLFNDYVGPKTTTA